MPTHKSAEKRMKTAEKSRQRNRRIKALVRGTVKEFDAEKSADKKADQFKKVASVLDKAAGKGVIHKNKAARAKSRLSKKIKK